MATALRKRRTARATPGSVAPSIIEADSQEAVEALRPRWRSLDVRSGCPSAQFGWIRAALAAFPDDAPPRVITVARGEQLVAAAPLVTTSAGGVRRLSLPGGEALGEPSDLACADPTSLAHLARAVVASGMPLHFARMPAASPAIGAIRTACRGRAVTRVRAATPYAYLPLDPSWIEPDHHLSQRRRNLLERAWRRAERLGPVSTEIHWPDLNELPAQLDAALAVDAAGLRTSSGQRKTADLHWAVFYRSFAQTACENGSLRICILKIGPRVAAMQLAIESGDALWLLRSGEDPELASCRPGQLLLRESIRHAAESELSSVEFWGNTSTWARGWAVEQRPCVSLTTYPIGTRGVAALASDAAGGQRPRVERTAKKLWSGAKKVAAGCAGPIQRVVRSYVAGAKLKDALHAADKLAQSNLQATIAYWDAPHEAPRRIADIYLEALRAVPGHGRWLSIKAPSLNFSRELVAELVDEARRHDVGLHFDATVREAARPTRDLVASFLDSGVKLGLTLPACWQRSVDDAAWAAAHGVTVRVVKGPWPDPGEPKGDRRGEFLRVIDALAGKASHVNVASHDVPLVAEAARRLQKAGAECELELLYGWPMRRSLEQAQRLGLSVTVHVPFGKSYLPHALSRLRMNPRHAWWLVRGSSGSDEFGAS
ncbi:MAG: GNAT family N-acetyltransferase [Planctomycetota bacterium]|nr:MAG: GNAT family N-acetyltransferase [Planctomycetota bacterium]